MDRRKKRRPNNKKQTFYNLIILKLNKMEDFKATWICYNVKCWWDT